MKAGALLAAAGIAALAAIQVAAEVQPTRDAANAVRRRRRVRLTPEQQMVRFGGFVEPAYDGRYVYFMNSQGRVPQEAVEWVAS